MCSREDPFPHSRARLALPEDRAGQPAGISHRVDIAMDGSQWVQWLVRTYVEKPLARATADLRAEGRQQVASRDVGLGKGAGVRMERGEGPHGPHPSDIGRGSKPLARTFLPSPSRVTMACVKRR